MIEVTVRDQQTFDKFTTRYLKLIKNTNDLTPVWKKYVPYYQNTIIKGAFNTSGKIMFSSWPSLSEKYAKKVGSTKRTLRRGDKLYKAATGGAGWSDTITKMELKMEIVGVPYANAHQYGYKKNNLPQAAYMFTTNEDIPKRAWAMLILMVDKYIEAPMKD